MKHKPGDTAPDFRLMDQNGEPRKLSGYKGKWGAAVLLSQGRHPRLNEGGP